MVSKQMYLKELERKAFKSTFQDGLWDVYLGLIVVWMALFVFRPESGYSIWNIVLMMAAFVVSYVLFWAGKRYVTVPRMGQVSFGPLRKRKKITLVIIMSVVVLIQAGFVALSVGGWVDTGFGAKLSTILSGGSMERVLVATIGSLFVGPSMILMAYFNDFPRGYYIAILMALAVFLMILLNQPLYPVLIGGLIVVPGVVLFVRFLRKYPLSQQETGHE